LVVKKVASTLAFVAFMLLSLAASTLLVNLADSNPIGIFPTEPEPLVVTFLSPINGSRCLQNTISIAFSLANPTLGGANSITYLIDGHTEGNVNGLINAKEGERFVGFFDLLNYSATLDLSGLGDGWHTLTVAASGTSPYNPSEGGMGSIFAEVYGSDSIQFLFDVTAPTVTVLVPQNQTYTTTDVPLNFTLSEKVDWIGYSLDEQPLVTVAGNTSLVALSEGPHSLKVYANDTVGRRGNSQAVFFVVRQETEEVVTNQPESESFPMMKAVAISVAVVAVVAVAALVYWKKRKR
jgi:hypothetical protein